MTNIYLQHRDHFRSQKNKRMPKVTVRKMVSIWQEREGWEVLVATQAEIEGRGLHTINAEKQYGDDAALVVDTYGLRDDEGMPREGDHEVEKEEFENAEAFLAQGWGDLTKSLIQDLEEPKKKYPKQYSFIVHVELPQGPEDDEQSAFVKVSQALREELDAGYFTRLEVTKTI